MQTERETMRKYLVLKVDQLVEEIDLAKEKVSELESELHALRLIWKMV